MNAQPLVWQERAQGRILLGCVCYGTKICSNGRSFPPVFAIGKLILRNAEERSLLSFIWNSIGQVHDPLLKFVKS